MDYELEDRQAEAGAQTSLQMCFAESMIGFDQSDDRDEIHAHRLAGKFCVVWTADHFCKSTDAFLGATEHLEHVAETAAAAELWIQEKYGEQPQPVGIYGPYAGSGPIPAWLADSPDCGPVPF